MSDADDRLDELEREAERGGGKERIAKQHEHGKLTARERLELLYDPNSFVELDKLKTHHCHRFDMDKQQVPGDSVVTGYGEVDGRKVFAYAQDFTVLGGTLSNSAGEKISKVIDLAQDAGVPVIGFNDSGGARIQEGVHSLGGYGDIATRIVESSGVIPQLSAIVGPCAGGASYCPALTDFIFMVEETSYMFVTGPGVVEKVSGEKVEKKELGGPSVHNKKSGVAHFQSGDDEGCIAQMRELLSFLPSNNLDDPPRVQTDDPSNRSTDEIRGIVPEDTSKPYDMRDVVEAVVDDNYLFEVQPQFGENIIVGFGRFDGRPAGVVANQPAHLAGCVDIDASKKASRFIRFCDAFNLPIVSFVDIPGFLPGVDQEHRGIISNGAKLAYAYIEATVPKISVITRKAYGGGYAVMGSKHLGGDLNYAYPTAEIAVMGPENAVELIFQDELRAAEDPARTKEELVERYSEEFANPYQAASYGYIDEVIRPAKTRERLIESLELLETKREENPPKKHGNMPT